MKFKKIGLFASVTLAAVTLVACGSEKKLRIKQQDRHKLKQLALQMSAMIQRESFIQFIMMLLLNIGKKKLIKK